MQIGPSLKEGEDKSSGYHSTTLDPLHHFNNSTCCVVSKFTVH